MEAKSRHIFIVVWGAVEILLFGGTIFGWASLVYIYKKDGYFGYLCDEDHPHGNVSATETWMGEGTSYVTPSSTPSDLYHTFDVMVTSYPSTNNVSHPGVNRLNTGVASSCHAQDKVFNLIYTLATFINGVTLFFNGFLMDRFGIRLCRCLGIITFIAGTLMAAFATQSSAFLLYPSMILLGLGGYYFLMTNMQLGNILPTKRSTIISLYCGAYDSSAFLLLLIKLAYEGGISLRTSFLLLTAAFSICVVSTFWFFPCRRIPHPIPANYTLPLTCGCEQDKPPTDYNLESNGKSPTTEQEPLSTIEKPRDNSEKASTGEQQTSKLLEEAPGGGLEEKKKETPSFYALVSSPLFLWDLVWLTCHRFASWSFVGRLNPTLATLAGGNVSVVGQYTSVYAMLQFFGIFLAPLSGRLMDRRPKHHPDTPHNPRLDKLEVCIASFVMDSTIGTLLAITLSVPILEVQYVSFVLHVMHRAFLYGPNSAFIAQAFPMEHFGKLFGLAMSFAAAFTLLQFPIFVIIQGPLKGNWLAANMFTLVLMLISYGHPIYITLWCRRQRQKDLKQRNSIYKPKQPVRLEVAALPDAQPESTRATHS